MSLQPQGVFAVRYLGLAVVVFTGLAGTTVWAADPAPAPADSGAMFAALDANHDGQLTSDEIPEERKRLFQRLLRTADKDQDGKLSAAEFAAGLKPAAQGESSPDGPGKPAAGQDGKPLFRQLDTNGDGKIRLDEVPEGRRERFEQIIKRADKDGDGALSEQEFAPFGDRLKGFAGRGKKPDQGKGEKGRPDPAQFFRRLDTNGDGKLTADEGPEARRPMIERMIQRGDKDGDKALSLEEFLAGAKIMETLKARAEGAEGRGPLPPGAGGKTLFGALDADHDGKLSSAEIGAAIEVIQKLDKNGDGSVTMEEVFGQAPAVPSEK